MANKITYVSALEIAINSVDSAEVREKLEALKTSIAKKNSAERKPTATQKANEGFKEAIANALEVGKAYTVTDIMKSVAEVSELSNQRVSALVRQMVENGTLERKEVKRKAYFSLVEGDEPNQFLDHEVTV